MLKKEIIEIDDEGKGENCLLKEPTIKIDDKGYGKSKQSTVIRCTLACHIHKGGRCGHGLRQASRNHIQLAMDIIHKSIAGPTTGSLDFHDRMVADIQGHGSPRAK